MGAVTECTTTNAWFTTLKVGGRNVKFEIDTEADISIMTEAYYNSLHHKPKLGPNKSILKTPSGILKNKGKFTAITKYRQSVYSFPVIVIPGRETTNNLLARSVAHTMGLIEKLDDVSEDIGTMKGDHVKITLRDDARRIPFPLVPKVKEELDRLEKLGVIMKITTSSDWCAPIVLVVKKNGNVRICVDLKRLNKAVKREHYMLPN